MNAGLLLIVAVPIFILGYKFYGRYISRIFDESDKNPTPAVEQCDDCDYVPTKPVVLFGHHFSAIAGAGPIVGPTLAMVFGFIPVWLWLVLGSVFVGAVHDYSALMASIREKGKSMAEVAEETLGKTGFLLFITFTLVMIVMVTSVFLRLTATSLTSMVPLTALSMNESQTLLKTSVQNGQVMAHIGGIASTSVIVITIFAPLIGYLNYRKKANSLLVALFAISVCIASILIGIQWPVSINPSTWMYVIAIYTLFAAWIPVWIILQPRDFTNSFLLYGGIAALAVGAILATAKGMTINTPALDIAAGNAKVGLMWPMLFITVACGACSGFHALVSGGTTSKQLNRESNGRKIAYGGMLLEGLLAVGVMVAIGVGLSHSQYMALVFPANGQSNPGAAFAVGMGSLIHSTLSIPAAYGSIFGILLVEGFLITTLDTAVRLNRYLLEELWSTLFNNPPWIKKTYAFNVLLSVGLMLYFSMHNTVMALWPVFGSANQLLAALTLIAISAWLVAKRKPFIFAILPAAFMLITTVYSLIYLLGKQYLPNKQMVLMVADGVLILLSVLVFSLALRAVFFRKRSVEDPEPLPETVGSSR